MSDEPTVPLRDAELLYVTLATVTHVLQTRTDYPTQNLLGVIGAYLQSRDAHLAAAGITPQQAGLYTQAAVDALLNWIERHGGDTDSESDFKKWAGEMLE